MSRTKATAGVVDGSWVTGPTSETGVVGGSSHPLATPVGHKPVDSPASYPRDWRTLGRLALSLGGYALTAGILVWGFSTNRFGIPGGDALIWDRVGDAMRAGTDIYLRTPTLSDTFWYAPPWAVAFAAVSWLPVQVMASGIIVLEVLSLRYIAGSWQRVGYFCWLPLVAFELPSSQFNLIMAAAIAAAIRGEPRGAVVMAAAKLSPILAVDPRQWRLVVPVAVVLVAVTLPWLHLWPAWVAHLASSYGADLAPAATIDVPFLPRLAVAGVLLLVRRPWARGLAAIVATPSIYWVSLVMLVALVPLRSPQER